MRDITVAQAPVRLDPGDVFVADTGQARGRGLFTHRPLSPGDRVMVCPVLLLEEEVDVLPTPIRQRVFAWNTLSDSTHPSALPLGYGSFLNHANPSNLAYTALPDHPGGPALIFSAVTDIPAGSELTINYNSHDGGPISPDDTYWFERMGVQRE